MRIGAFFFDSASVLLTEKLLLPEKLPEPEEDPERTIQTAGTCVLTNARTGIWLAGTPYPHSVSFSISKAPRIRTV